MEIKAEATKRGFPAMWERGGAMTSGGSAQVIAGRNGEPRKPVFVRTRGHLACGDHALITIHDGYYIVRVGVSHGELDSATILRVTSVTSREVEGGWVASAEVEEVNSFDRGEWDSPLESKLKAAVEAATEKARWYHCRSAVYIDQSDQ